MARPLVVWSVAAWLVAVPASLAFAQEQKPQRPVPPNRDASAPQPSGTAIITGTLVGIDSGRPIRRATVSLTAVGPDTPSRAATVTTDDLGTFTFSDLPAGTYNLAATKPGYLDSNYGQQRPGTGRAGTPVRVADGQKIDRLSFPMARGGAISGTVVDEVGDQAFGVQVRVFRSTVRSGQPTLQSLGSTQTDDRGAFRIGVLPPGQYVVAVYPRDSSNNVDVAQLKQAAEGLAQRAQSGSDEQAVVLLKSQIARARDADPAEIYAPMYFPGTIVASSAMPVMIEPGQERGSVDFQLQLVRTSRISGVVTSAEGTSLQNAAVKQVTLVDLDQLLAGNNTRTVQVDGDGKFSMPGVPPGRYTLIARATIAPAGDPAARGQDALKKSGGMNGTQLWATTDLSVDGRAIPDLSLVLQRGMSVAGTIKLDTGAQGFDFTRLRVVLAPGGAVSAGNDPFQPATVDSTGRFTFPGVLPGTYRVSVSGQPSNWMAKSAVFGGRDALDLMLDVKPGEDQSGVITLTTRSAALSGKIQDSTGQPTSAYTIVLFAADTRFWVPQSRRIQATRPATDGRFSFSNLPAGDYRLVAITDAEPGQWFDPAFLRELAGSALSITIGDGEQRVQDIRVK